MHTLIHVHKDVTMEGRLGQPKDGFDIVMYGATTEDLKNESITNLLISRLFTPSQVCKKTSSSSTNIISVGVGTKLIGLSQQVSHDEVIGESAISEFITSKSDNEKVIGAFFFEKTSIELTPTSSKCIMVRAWRMVRHRLHGYRGPQSGVLQPDPGTPHTYTLTSHKR